MRTRGRGTAALLATALAGALLGLPGVGWSAALVLRSDALTVASLPSPTLYASSVASTDDRGGGRGKVDTGDSTTLVLGGRLRPSSLCSTWVETATPQTVTGLTLRLLDGAGTGGNDVLVVDTAPTGGCAGGLRLGTVDTGSAGFVTGGSVSFTASTATLTWTATSATLDVVFGTRSGPLANPGVATVLTWTPDPGLLDGSGLAIADGTASSVSAVQW
ncbi:MAG: hypothetical protein Q8R60_04740 [Mycobacteriales bacterium]|nr:hypothetical protein [Mycobacteriales bacterium]